MANAVQAATEVAIAGAHAPLVAAVGVNIPNVCANAAQLFDQARLFVIPGLSHVILYPVPGEPGLDGAGELRVNAIWYRNVREGAALDFNGMCEFLTERKLARNYHPERLEVIAAFPRTPSGKIQKFRLRELLQQAGL